MKKYDFVAAFAFGLPPMLGANMQIVKRASVLAYSLGIPALAEGVMPQHFTNVEVMLKDGSYSSTLKAVKRFAALANKEGWKKVLVVAAPPHTKRCLRDLRKYGLKAEADDYFQTKGMTLYDKESTQKWTRSAWRFLPREIILRLLPFWLYDLIAG